MNANPLIWPLSNLGREIFVICPNLENRLNNESCVLFGGIFSMYMVCRSYSVCSMGAVLLILSFSNCMHYENFTVTIDDCVMAVISSSFWTFSWTILLN